MFTNHSKNSSLLLRSIRAYIRERSTFFTVEKMPEDFNPHTELERIYNLRELMLACRQRVPSILSKMDEMLNDDTVPHSERLKLYDMMLNRAYGKPRQVVYVSDDTSANQSASRVKVYLPDNGRITNPVKVIDAEAA